MVVDIGNLASAVEQYRIAYGHLPIANGSADRQRNSDIVNALTNNPQNLIFIEWSASHMTNGQILDPWGTPYNFAVHTNHQTPFQLGTNLITGDVAIWSNGPNRQDENGGRDDIANWKPH